jgi:hypothetical protein
MIPVTSRDHCVQANEPCNTMDVLRQVRVAAGVAHALDLGEQAAGHGASLRPPAGQVVLVVGRRTWLRRHGMPIGQRLQLDPFVDAPAAEAEFTGDGSCSPAGLVQRAYLLEHDVPDPVQARLRCLFLDRRTGLPPHGPAKARQLLLDLLAQGLDQVEAVGDLPGLRRPLPCTLGIQPVAIAADDLHLRVVT